MRRYSILLEKLNENLNHSDKPIKTTTIEKKKKNAEQLETLCTVGGL